ncbi:MAG TPA: type IV toxin-antitoxin system AbiEi family antitoxin domain-containing protein [Solirubrobacterales bacterium]|nr:type IV toxin-antitoxin system AbiEi family antitoxin domain-containing protein [Solirubrobacterales bacterium]
MSEARSAQTWRLAARQHGILARPQLLALGFSARAIEHRIAYGRLHRVTRGIYAVGWPHLDQRRRWAAALLTAAAGDRAARLSRASGETGGLSTQPYFGNSAVLSHRSAAALLGIGEEAALRIDLSIRRREARPRPGLRIHGRPTLALAEVQLLDGLPVTTPVRTLIDLATELSPIAIERAVNNADKRDLIDPEALRLALDVHAGEPGVRPLRQVLDRLTFRLSDSDLEIYFRPIASSAGLRSPLSKHRVNGFEVDFYWPDLGLVVETDGLRYHRTPSAQRRDALRDRAHIIAGMTPLRFTHYEIRYEGRRVRSELSQVSALLQKRIRH